MNLDTLDYETIAEHLRLVWSKRSLLNGPYYSASTMMYLLEQILNRDLKYFDDFVELVKTLEELKIIKVVSDNFGVDNYIILGDNGIEH